MPEAQPISTLVSSFLEYAGGASADKRFDFEGVDRTDSSNLSSWTIPKAEGLPTGFYSYIGMNFAGAIAGVIAMLIEQYWVLWFIGALLIASLAFFVKNLLGKPVHFNLESESGKAHTIVAGNGPAAKQLSDFLNTFANRAN